MSPGFLLRHHPAQHLVRCTDADTAAGTRDVAPRNPGPTVLARWLLGRGVRTGAEISEQSDAPCPGRRRRCWVRDLLVRPSPVGIPARPAVDLRAGHSRDTTPWAWPGPTRNVRSTTMTPAVVGSRRRRTANHAGPTSVMVLLLPRSAAAWTTMRQPLRWRFGVCPSLTR